MAVHNNRNTTCRLCGPREEDDSHRNSIPTEATGRTVRLLSKNIVSLRDGLEQTIDWYRYDWPIGGTIFSVGPPEVDVKEATCSSWEAKQTLQGTQRVIAPELTEAFGVVAPT